MQLGPDGAQLIPAAFTTREIELLESVLAGALRRGPGARLRPIPGLAPAIQPATRAAASILGHRVRPVRATLFDKSPARNWSLGWHQDRTIAVRRRIETAGFTRWTMKAGIAHVVPPFDILDCMLTLRIHLDPAGPDNAPLMVVPGSHRLGPIAERDIAAIVAHRRAEACEAARGDLWLYATPILHASARAARPLRRRVLQLMYSCENLPGGLAWLGC